MSRVCAALSDFDFSSEDSSSSEEDEKPKCIKGYFTDLCLIGKSLRNVSNSDSDVSDDLSFESLSLRVAELENALCNQDKLLCKVFRENKKLNLELESSFSEIASLWLVHDDISAKSCDNCKMIMVNYADLWLVHTKVTSQLDGAKLELKELKARSLLLGAYTSCPLLKSDLEACAVEIKVIMLETHIVVSSLIFRLVFILVCHLTSLMDLTITHMVLVHERTTLCLYALVMAHVLIVVIISRVDPIFLLEGLTLTLSPDTWMVHIFPIVVHVLLDQMVKCKRLRRHPLVAWLSDGFLRFISLTPALSHRPLLILCR
jgi:hypothetical protein